MRKVKKIGDGEGDIVGILGGVMREEDWCLILNCFGGVVLWIKKKNE